MKPSPPLAIPGDGVTLLVSRARPPKFLEARIAPLLAAADQADRAWVASIVEAYGERGELAFDDLTREQAIELLKLAFRGVQFAPKGRGKGKLRQLIEREAGRIGAMPAREAWDYLAGLSSRRRMNVEFHADHVFIPGEGTVGLRRFANLLAEVRRASE